MYRPSDVAIVGVGYSPVERRSQRTLGQLTVASCWAAIEDAGLEITEIDGISNYPSPSRVGAGDLDGVDVVTVEYLARAIGLKQLRWHSSLTRGSFTGSVVEAANAVASGACECALAWRAMHNPPGKFGRAVPQPVRGDDQFTAPYGFANEIVKWSMPYARYIAQYGATRADMARLVVQSRENAAHNPDAVFFELPITVQEYLDSRMIVDPVSLLDCDMPVDACSAVVVTTAERARSLRQQPVFIWAGVNLGLPPKRRPTYVLHDYQAAARAMADVTLAAAGVGVSDFTHAQLYDGFAFHVWFWLEAFGFCGEGDAAAFVNRTRTGLEGHLPINTGGGSIGMGRLHGGAQVIEAALQIQRRCGLRQIKDPALALVTAGSPITGAGALVMSSEPPGKRRP